MYVDGYIRGRLRVILIGCSIISRLKYTLQNAFGWMKVVTPKFYIWEHVQLFIDAMSDSNFKRVFLYWTIFVLTLSGTCTNPPFRFPRGPGFPRDDIVKKLNIQISY